MPYFRAGAMSLNQVVPNVANLKIGWFHSIKSQKSSGSIAPFSKIKWFHGTTGTTTNAGPALGNIFIIDLIRPQIKCPRGQKEIEKKDDNKSNSTMKRFYFKCCSN